MKQTSDTLKEFNTEEPAYVKANKALDKVIEEGGRVSAAIVEWQKICKGTCTVIAKDKKDRM